MRKKILSLGLVMGMMLSLTGCGDDSNATISSLNSIESLGSESSVSSDYSLSYTDEQNMIYAQVADRTLLDLSTLDACTDSELQQAVAYMDEVDNILTGSTQAGQDLFLGDGVTDDEKISHYLTDYVLTEFERTPYQWQRTQTVVRGIDSESRSIVVDVTYKTIGFEKDVKPDSSIVRGDPDYATKTEVRFNRYLDILSLQYNTPDDPTIAQKWKTWRESYGNEEDVIAEQTEGFLSDRIFETGIQTTYNGLIDNEADKSGGTMTIRYILVPNYTLGINLGLTCEHLYVTNYQLDNDITDGSIVFTEEGYATISDEVQKLIYSYFQCIDESDFSGLYKLTKNFGTLDKYYEDVFDTTYSKHDNFTLSLFSIQGTHITCGVTISSKERARGSEMTYPVYTDRYYFELDLTGGELQVSNMTLLSRTLEGEPAITTDSADTTGFVAGVDITNDDKLAIEDLICKFGALQLNNDTSSDNFGDCVDLSMSTSNQTTLKTNMTSLTGVKKVTWLQNYQQGTSNYASVKCRELFQDSTNAIVEANVTYEFINKGGRWYVYAYDINSSVKLDTTNLSTTGSLCLVSPGKVEAYTSQIKSTTTSDTETVSDISVTYDHKEYTPTRKTASTEQGLTKYTKSDVVSLWDELDYSSTTYEDMLSTLNDMSDEDARNTASDLVFRAFLLKANVDNGAYTSVAEFTEDKDAIQSEFDALTEQLLTSEDSSWEDIADIIRELLQIALYSGN